MNYYERHLGDYAKDTAHLSMLEHGAYTLLLDRYYSTEAGIPEDQAHRVARARTRDEKQAVDVVLNEFFVLTDGVWISGRAEEEIEKAHQRISAARENGKKGGRPRKAKETQQKPSGLLLGSEIETQQKAHHVPDTIQKHSEGKPSGGKPPISDPDEIIFGYGVPLLTNAGTPEKQARSFLGGLRKNHGDQSVIDKLRECLKTKPLQPLEWLAAALPPSGGGARSNGRTPALDGFDSKNYGTGGRL